MLAMAKPKHYSKAPITEAIIDIRVSLSDQVKVSDLALMAEGEESSYPERRDRFYAEGRFQLGKDISASASSKHTGYVFYSEDKKQIFQAKLDGFTMSRLAPYGSWKPFRDEARRLWEKYRRIVNPTSINRLAVRYLNRIDIPLPLNDFDDYLLTMPQIAPDLPQELEGFFVRLQIPQPDIPVTLLLSEAIVEPARDGVVSVVLDIDMYRDKEVPCDEESIWDFFEVLHDRKNVVFEACITDDTRELIK